MKPTHTFILLITVLFLQACGPKPIQLSGPKVPADWSNILWTCLGQANNEIETGKTLSLEEQKQLKGIDTSYFLWWGSMRGPMPVVNRSKYPAEAISAFPRSESKRALSDRYVLCLLNNGYSFPEEEYVRERYGETEKAEEKSNLTN